MKRQAIPVWSGGQLLDLTSEPVSFAAMMIQDPYEGQSHRANMAIQPLKVGSSVFPQNNSKPKQVLFPQKPSGLKVGIAGSASGRKLRYDLF